MEIDCQYPQNRTMLSFIESLSIIDPVSSPSIESALVFRNLSSQIASTSDRIKLSGILWVDAGTTRVGLAHMETHLKDWVKFGVGREQLTEIAQA